ncbi:MAG: hypothetical protein JJLCMIEE_02858 [Acidimicrobiales bacterium]|nr:MAG: DUF3566 domain-containing protein [Actinomycetota bacterium]MBV6509759.1 hypothetical protein [Acidimicrobiales bacterium]RIK04847.1 MAG: hypothetical protein DCC48_12470 [Acidobacteriota bacterium]
MSPERTDLTAEAEEPSDVTVSAAEPDSGHEGREGSNGSEERPSVESVQFDATVQTAPSKGLRRVTPTQRMGYLARRRATRFRAKKVRRLVRHIDPWSVLKLSLLFFICVWVIFMIAGVMLWSVAVTSGTITNVENFVEELLALPEFQFDADLLFRRGALIGLIMVLGSTGAVVLGAVIFNLISDLIGGVWITVIEEETARPSPDSAPVP